MLRHLHPLDFQVWTMMQNPRDLLIRTARKDWKALTARVYGKNWFQKATDAAIMWYIFWRNG